MLLDDQHVLLESHLMMLDRVHLGVESMLLLEQTTHSLEIQPLVLESRQQWLDIQLQRFVSLFGSFLIVDESKTNQYRVPNPNENQSIKMETW